MTLVNILMESVLFFIIFFGFKLPSEQTKIYFRGDFSCIFNTIFFNMVEHDSLNFYFCVGLALLEAKSDLVAVASLTESKGKKFLSYQDRS